MIYLESICITFKKKLFETIFMSLYLYWWSKKRPHGRARFIRGTVRTGWLKALIQWNSRILEVSPQLKSKTPKNTKCQFYDKQIRDEYYL